jgi:hypothetical protein
MENKKNKIRFIVFIIFLFVLAIGGYFGMNYVINTDFSTKKDDNNAIQVVDNKLDSSKDYIYYDNVKRVLNYLEIDMEDVYINLNCAKDINQKLNNEMSTMRNSIIYIKDHAIPAGTDYENNEEGIYSLNYREYDDYYYDDFISLVSKDYAYDVINGATATKIQGYVFDKKNNKQLSEDDLLNKYNQSITNIKTLLRRQLNSEQTTTDGKSNIDIDGTINNLNYSLYITKIGKLEISYIVKSTNQNYYDKLVLS